MNCTVCLLFVNWKCRVVIVKVSEFLINFLLISCTLLVLSEWGKRKNIPLQLYFNISQDLGHTAAVVNGNGMLLSVCVIWNRFWCSNLWFFPPEFVVFFPPLNLWFFPVLIFSFWTVCHWEKYAVGTCWEHQCCFKLMAWYSVWEGET